MTRKNVKGFCNSSLSVNKRILERVDASFKKCFSEGGDSQDAYLLIGKERSRLVDYCNRINYKNHDIVQCPSSVARTYFGVLGAINSLRYETLFF
jgi:hypothetical protein